MWPTFAKYEEHYDFTVSRSTEKDCYCYTLTPSSPISVPGIIKFLNCYFSSVLILFTHVNTSIRVQATEWIQLMPTPYLAEGGTDVFTIYREAFLPPYNKENIVIDKLELLHILCKPASPMWANTSLSQFSLFHRIYTDVSRLTQPQTPQMMFQDRCDRNGTLVSKKIYTLLNSIAGAQYYLEQVQELDKNAQISPITKPAPTDVICTDVSKY
ncbi:Hypothetical protein GLP15_3753 [Giardia lamblia P15]|uniref:Uncharacterized protein n=1 Tax=Giardia intestinalis (strain P15) TaxID=658858 RepID=E1F281_GIAIA|nr:Hypothetical protein GLP15_3753 [Giardia lamblia P15]